MREGEETGQGELSREAPAQATRRVLWSISTASELVSLSYVSWAFLLLPCSPMAVGQPEVI